VLGGKYVTIVAGAVPKVLNGDPVALPPEVVSPSLLIQFVVNTNCVPELAVLAYRAILLFVYGAESAY
jgi:hypothetical protein